MSIRVRNSTKYLVLGRGPEADRYEAAQMTPEPESVTTQMATHYLGRALGLWGQSDQPQSVMFEANARPLDGQLEPSITARDLNTLKRVYEQPTLIGIQFSEDLMN